MIVEPSVEKLLEKAENRYELVIAISRRARQLEGVKSNNIESKITKAAIEFNNNDCYIIDSNIDEENNEE